MSVIGRLIKVAAPLVALLAIGTGALAVTKTFKARVDSGQADAQVSADYRVGSEDTLTVTVLRHPEFSGDFLVPQSGDVSFPAAGTIHVAGMSLADIQRRLTDRLNQRLWKAEVSVTLKTQRIQRVYVLGNVFQSGAYDWKPGWTIVQALASAGGLDREVPLNDVTVTLLRSGEPAHKFRLTTALDHADSSEYRLSPGDTVRFEDVLTIPVYVSGEVQKPGLYQMRGDSATALAAITAASGLTPQGSFQVRVDHADGTDSIVDLGPTLLRGATMPLVHLRPGDVVVVPQSYQRFTVLGYVGKAGYFPLPNGRPMHLAEALASAEGALSATGSDSHGRITRVGLVHVSQGKVDHNIYNLDRFLNKGDLSQNPLIQDGDIIYVPQDASPHLLTIVESLAAAVSLYYNARF